MPMSFMLENCREMKSNNYLYSVNILCVFFRRDEELMWVFHAVCYPLNIPKNLVLSTSLVGRWN